MFFLLEAFGDFAEWGQFAVGLGALIVAIVAYHQGKSIRELTEMTAELAKQTAELQAQTTQLQAQSNTQENRYQLELLLSTDKRMPFFEHLSIQNIDDSTPGYRVTLLNAGQKALFVVPIAGSGVKDQIKLHCTETDCPNNCGLVTDIMYDDIMARSNTSFTFHIEFSDKLNIRYRQTIRQISAQGDYVVLAPVVVFVPEGVTYHLPFTTGGGQAL